MPGKSQRGKGRHAHQSKKSKAKQRQRAMASQQPIAADTPKPAVTISKPTSSGTSAAPVTSKVGRYPYITTELLRIGILAGIILVILIVLALVLP
jgi:hypothetical protein